jgi:cytochrome P450
VQNTRRFIAEDAVICGRALRGGDAVLVLLAAANRDPAANPRPERFDLDRSSRRIFTFGAGAHACPGPRLAKAIAAAGVLELLERGFDPDGLALPPVYRRSVNSRVPLLGGASSGV